MAFDIHASHRTILLLPLAIYVGLVVIVAVLPARDLAERYPGNPERKAASPLAAEGEEVFKAYGCVVCHTQQIRGDERVRVQSGDRKVIPVRAPDARYGLDEPTTPEEYADASPPMLGTQRTGPDLTGVGDRLPSVVWHYWHLYDPRSVSPGSVMPPYRELFYVVSGPDGKLAPPAPFNTGRAYLMLGGLAVVFVGLGWLLFGSTPALLVALVLGVGAGFLLVNECRECAPGNEEGELVEESIDALGLPPEARLVATPKAQALAEYLLSLRRPVRKP